MSRSSTIVGLVAACALAALGCKQGLGDRCEINSDCSSGFCSMNGAGIGGTCVDLSRPTTTGQGGSGGTSSTGNDGASGGAGGGDAGGDTGVDWGGMTASGALVILPVLIFSFAAQRHLVAGLSSGAVKG